MNDSSWFADIAERAARIAAAIAILFACAVMVHQHTHQADRAPYIAVDDALANVSVSMVALGRNAFPASPIQGASGAADPRRHEVQLNYGYAPFMLGAALDWLFGTSHAVLRSIHIVGLMLAIGAAWLTFRTEAPLAAVMFTSLVVGTLWPVHWPMFRPDIGTALCAIVAVAFATSALHYNALIAWLGAGFFAATAFGSHQIAWTMVPWAGVIWLVSLGLADSERRWSDITIGPFLAVTAGGIIGLLVYARGIGWRVGDVVTMWTSSWDVLTAQSKLSFLDVLTRHFQSAWSSLRKSQVILLHIGVATGLVLSILLAWRRHPLARAVAAITLPGSLAALAYLLGSGFYRNWHAGYTLLNQLATSWGAVAAIAAALMLARAHIGETARPWIAAATLTGAIVLGVNSSKQLAAGTAWRDYAGSYVPFSEYEARVLADVPVGSSAAGSVIFGLKSGLRYHLVQASDTLALLEGLSPSTQRRLLPNHIVLNSELADTIRLVAAASAESRMSTLVSLGGLIGGNGPFSQPGVTYGETAIVYAEPYGETRVLTLAGAGRPAISIYDAPTQTWASRFAPVEVPAATDAFVALNVRGSPNRLPAAAGLAVRVDPGTYLAEVDISGRPDGVAIVTGSTPPTVHVEPGALNPLGKASGALAFTGNRTLHVLLRAPEGIAHVGYFGAPLTKPLTIRRLERLVVDPERVTPLALPPLSEWIVQASGAKLVVSEDGQSASLAGVGIPVGYQLSSPPIAVPSDTKIIISFAVSSEAGHVALGVIDSKGYWIEQPVSDGRLTINTRHHTSMRLLLTSMEGKPLAEPARFELRINGAALRGTYSPRRLYVDDLARCFGPGLSAEARAACK